eukprot:352029-Chlamydomonas_euryale.AAC.1
MQAVWRKGMGLPPPPRRRPISDSKSQEQHLRAALRRCVAALKVLTTVQSAVCAVNMYDRRIPGNFIHVIYVTYAYTRVIRVEPTLIATIAALTTFHETTVQRQLPTTCKALCLGSRTAAGDMLAGKSVYLSKQNFDAQPHVQLVPSNKGSFSLRSETICCASIATTTTTTCALSSSLGRTLCMHCKARKGEW